MTNSTHFLYSYAAVRILRIYPILSRCGALYRLFLLGFCQSLFVDKWNQLHTFFFIYNAEVWSYLAEVSCYYGKFR